jgi:biopolymer transport protein ExbD/biopolymer transport protein TolR
MAITVRNEGAKISSNINVTPLVDVMLVLLIIFMVIMPMLPRDVPVDLAKANNSMDMRDADNEDALIVAVTSDNRVYLDRDQVNAADLTGKIKDRIANRPNKEVFVKADARARYKSVVAVVDNVRSAGVDLLGLLTEQRKGATAGVGGS